MFQQRSMSSYSCLVLYVHATAQAKYNLLFMRIMVTNAMLIKIIFKDFCSQKGILVVKPNALLLSGIVFGLQQSDKIDIKNLVSCFFFLTIFLLKQKILHVKIRSQICYNFDWYALEISLVYRSTQCPDFLIVPLNIKKTVTFCQVSQFVLLFQI